MSAVASHMMKRVLVLGSGFMSGPLVELLTRDGTVAVTVASNIEEQARQLARSFQNTTATKIDVKSESSLGSLISSHDLVVSYVPYQLHPLVAKQCITHHVNMVTSSYVSPALKELEDQVNASGITMLNEVGLDPGIDHMLAMECFDEVHGKGGKVTSFQSWCGGLPAPECANNPLKYKFSWSPRNVILGTLHPAKYLKDGKVVEIPAGGSVMGVAKPVQLYPDVELEGYPNRDSVPYMDIYGIPEARDIFRGTLRYKGFCSVAVGLQKLGLVSETQHQRLQPDAAPLRWKDLLGMLISQTDITQPDLQSAVYEALDRDDLKMKAIEDLRLLSDDPVDLCGSPLDSLSSHLQRMLQYSPGEKDAIYLHHTVGIEWPDKTKELRHINLTLYGAPHGFSAMAQCVGKPAAIAAMMILNGELTKKGILRPMSRDVYTPVLDKLGREGIKATIRTEHS